MMVFDHYLGVERESFPEFPEGRALWDALCPRCLMDRAVFVVCVGGNDYYRICPACMRLANPRGRMGTITFPAGMGTGDSGSPAENHTGNPASPPV